MRGDGEMREGKREPTPEEEFERLLAESEALATAAMAEANIALRRELWTKAGWLHEQAFEALRSGRDAT
jgi:hypothetical protein